LGKKVAYAAFYPNPARADFSLWAQGAHHNRKSLKCQVDAGLMIM